MTAMYHIHSGFNRVGSCVWDLWQLLRDENPDAVSFNFDIGHATVEGGFGGWINTMRLALPHTRGTAAKDFIWEKNAKGEWRPRWCPLGEGMVDWPKYFAMLKESTVAMPLQLHLEYHELGSAGTGGKTLDLPRDRVVAMLKKDMAKLKELRAQAGLG
jgi:sugar phosphate isomerase/epimerase